MIADHDSRIESENRRDQHAVTSIPYQVKAYNLRGVITSLADLGLLEEVKARCGESTRALLESPPPASAWVDGDVFFEVSEIVGALRGDAVVLEIGRRSLQQGALAILRPVVEGFLRLFGTSPATLFSRIATISASSSRGNEIEYRAINESSGVIAMNYPATPNIPRTFWLTFMGSMQSVFELCGAKGTISEPIVRKSGGGTSAEFVVSWSEKK